MTSIDKLFIILSTNTEKLTLFSKKKIMSVIAKCMVFRLTDEEIIKEIQKEFPTNNMISQPMLSRMKKEIKERCIDFYNTIKKIKILFYIAMIEKY
jgi:hypothetical protein